MLKKWEIKKNEDEYVIVENEEFKIAIDEFAEIVYGYLCQLCEPSLAPEICAVNPARKTGTDA